MEELFTWAKTSELHPVLKSAILHYEIETVHPFADGNGRMGRLWQTLLLAKGNEIFAWIPMESALFKNHPQYYAAIEEARKVNDSGVFIEFTLSALYEILLDTAMSGGDEVGVDRGVENNADKILKAIAAQPKITQKQLAATTGLSERTISREIKQLRDSGLIRRIGSDRAGYWKIVKNL